ncbi:dihydropteroate synthase [Flavobacterium selenitireducens]|uniref:dihydropteroate synthase n=1 Tax=Flavobacterium selenitireducens TaxID=2722704 RepID=UPI00168A60A6|nr:dihydropteroate synthase [Flavobacterium selenitireducens]MBD3582929.1 dihydropteroate synthase [Flavobacterium selenitireducens]
MTINCKGTLVDLSHPKVMGILNITPDSFFDGGQYKSDGQVLRRAEKILSDGASFIDIGGYSSRPGADFVSEEEEIARLLPAIEIVLKEFPEALLSIDTFRSAVATACINRGAAIVNDISGGWLDDRMLETVAGLQVPYIAMHMRGTPATMQQFTQYEDLVREVMHYFSERVFQARQLGLNDIIIDPGFGFSKTLSQNYELLHKLEAFQFLELPVLVGISRKSMIYKLLETKAEEALNGTTVLNTIALSKGASILRVHDVKEAVECVRIVSQFS